MHTEYTPIAEQIARLNADTGRVWSYGRTGGNCSAYTSNEVNGDYLMITHQAQAPISAEEWAEATCGYYSEVNNFDPDSVEEFTQGDYAEVVRFVRAITTEFPDSYFSEGAE